jgi:hypothetical protein
MNNVLHSLPRFYKWQADPEQVVEAAAAAADSTPAPATPQRGSRPLPVLRVTRSADKRQQTEDELLTPDACAAAAASPRSKRAAAVPRAASHRAQQQNIDAWEATEKQVRKILIALLFAY